jgi:hypothetical protein
MRRGFVRNRLGRACREIRGQSETRGRSEVFERRDPLSGERPFGRIEALERRERPLSASCALFQDPD